MALPEEGARPYDDWLVSEWSAAAASGRAGPAAAADGGRPWWVRASLNQFKARCLTLARADLEKLMGDVRGLIAHLQLQFESRGRGDAAWWDRAHMMHTATIAKRRELGNILRDKAPVNVPKANRVQTIRAARAELAAGNERQALSMLLEMLEALWAKE